MFEDYYPMWFSYPPKAFACFNIRKDKPVDKNKTILYLIWIARLFKLNVQNKI